MLDNESFNLIADYWLSRVGLATGQWCPCCRSENVKKFGHSAAGSQRHRCNHCGKTFTGVSYSDHALSRFEALKHWMSSKTSIAPETDLKLSAVQIDRSFESLETISLAEMHNLAIAEDVATTYLKVPYKGQANFLWFLVSSDIASGRILHISSTFIPFILPKSGCYQWDIPELGEEIVDEGNRAIVQAEHRENVFLKRTQFDRIYYGKTLLKNKNYRAALPVLIAHCHFLVLSKLGHGRNRHCLTHEMFFRGACITQYSKYVKAEGTSIFYVVGACDTKTKLSGQKYVGWWRNLWHEFEDSKGRTMALSRVCGNKALPISMIAFDPISEFKEQLCASFSQFEMIAPKRVVSMVICSSQTGHRIKRHIVFQS
ncbi:hypothetical protein [uncultured Vibrio sp.]|uniref:IS1/IS1595 family N-terminal zinc-binding domain-containing protein n=1 Tax=uncultured Vibrio sp. TaxID=114054 RepID=UPI0026040ADD|nr:hypothetical protein [uncultured Vibrio sp.]